MLNEKVFRSEDVPVADRLAYWAERVGQTHAPARMSSDHAHDFRATQRVLDLGAVSVWPARFQQLVIRRTPKLIRQSDPEVYHLSLVMGGTGVGNWDGHEAVYRPSDLHINDSSVPWEVRTGRDPVTAALFAHAFEAESVLPADTHRRTLTLSIKNFIQEHLHDPQLTPGSVAAAHFEEWMGPYRPASAPSSARRVRAGRAAAMACRSAGVSWAISGIR